MGLPFPSLEWFQALQDAMNANTEKYRKLGVVDFALAVSVLADASLPEPKVYGVVFDGYWCKDVREISSADEIEAECVLEGDYETWREMLENIKANGHADVYHTLNRLTLPETPMRVRGDDQLGVDKFYRYQGSLQEFFEESARFETDFVG